MKHPITACLITLGLLLAACAAVAILFIFRPRQLARDLAEANRGRMS